MSPDFLSESPVASRDRFSAVFDLVDVRGVLTGVVAARGAWRAAADVDHPLKFFVLLSGSARLSATGLDRPIDLAPGDVGILNGPTWVECRGGPVDEDPHEVDPEDFPPLALEHVLADGPADVLLGGRIDLNPAGESLLTAALAPVSHIRSAQAAPRLRATVDMLLAELTSPGMGTEFAVRQHCQLLLLEMVRAYVEQAAVPPGWLRLLSDRQLRPALDLMHGEPGRRWSLEELARAARMSRTSFAERFRAVADVPPLAYLSRWRIMLAQRALREGDTRVGTLAAQLGYGSESTFSNAFKRETGMSPLRYRRHVTQPGRVERETVAAS